MKIEDIILEAYKEYRARLDKMGYIGVPAEEEKNLAEYIAQAIRTRCSYIGGDN